MTIPSSKKIVYNSFIICTSLHDEVIPLPNNKIEEFHDDVYYSL